MSKVLGDYKGTVPSTLITQKRATLVALHLRLCIDKTDMGARA